MSESTVEIARRGYDAWLRGELDAISEFLDPEVKWHGGDASAPGACRNREEALEFMLRARRRGWVGELVDVIDAGDKVVLIIRSTPNDDGEGTLSANLTTFRDGKAIEMVHYANAEEALAAAGV
jgi:ketosteroid isomerase-like protein